MSFRSRVETSEDRVTPRKTFIGLAVWALVCAGTASAQDAPQGNAEHGRQLFTDKGCYSCHGFVGQGSREAPRIAPPIAFPAFELQLRQPRAIMPPYEPKIVSDQEAADIYAYLGSLPKPPDPKTVKLLQ